MVDEVKLSELKQMYDQCLEKVVQLRESYTRTPQRAEEIAKELHQQQWELEALRRIIDMVEELPW